MAERILIIDDDEKLAKLVVDYLDQYGVSGEYRVDATSGLEAVREGGFDALILDVMLPDIEGFEVCRRIRGFSDIPILMLTARGEETDRIVGLEIGADDYLPKPFNPRELLARIRAILRRGKRAAPESAKQDVLKIGPLEIDVASREVRLEDKSLSISGYQFDLLEALAGNAGRVMSRDALMNIVKGESHEAFDRSIDVHISRLRAALGDDPRQPRFIHTYRGTGYMLKDAGSGGSEGHE